MHGDRRAHEDDLDHVVQRAVAAGCEKFMITGSDLEESRKAVELAKVYRESKHCVCCVACLRRYIFPRRGQSWHMQDARGLTLSCSGKMLRDDRRASMLSKVFHNTRRWP